MENEVPFKWAQNVVVVINALLDLLALNMSIGNWGALSFLSNLLRQF